MSFNRRLPLALLAFGLALLLIPAAYAGLRYAPIHLSSPALGMPIMTSTGIVVMTEDGRLRTYDNAMGKAGTPYELGQVSHIPPAVTETVILTATDDGRIEAVDRDRLRRLWVYPREEVPAKTVKPPAKTAAENNTVRALQVRSMVSSGTGLVYVIDKTRVLAFEERTGTLRFNYELLQDGGAADADGERVYVMDGPTLKAIGADGALRWSLETGAVYKTRPVADPQRGRVYVASTQGMIQAIDAKTGEVNWSYSINGWPMATPLPFAEHVLIGTNDGRLRALDARNGSPVWTASLGAALWGEMSIISRGNERLVVVTTQAPSVAAVDADTGERRWDYPLPEWAGSPAVSADSSQIALTTRDNSLVVIMASPMCSIDTPKDQQMIGPYPEIAGRAWAWGGAKRVALIVGGERVELVVGADGMFNHSPDLSGLRDGKLDIQCLAESKDNQVEKDAGVRKIAPVLSVNAQKAVMVITMVPSAQPGEAVRVFVRNADGFDLEQLSVDFAGQHLQGQKSPLQLQAPSNEGEAVLTLNRQGFDPASATLSVVADKTPIYALAVVGIVVVGIVAYALLSRKRRAG